MRHLSELWKVSLILGPIFTILFGTSISSLFLGYTKYNQCPFQPFLPQGLVGFGLIGSLSSITALILIVVSFFKVDDSGAHLWYLVYAIIMVAIYSASAFIWTSIIVLLLRAEYSNYQSENSTDLKSFCHASIDNFCNVFATTVGALALIFFIWFIRCLGLKLWKFFGKTLSVQERR
ncbi:unnamed protein product [Rotaria socialis]|uniref:Uncharacterized protein n=1 Tax=Rotaria socialis TaxID=392032 RepID=A0A817YS50_9BILA|nr:unnamed protein product [Rotaria socialis]CAF4435855.1 unnamed protein product [Rotaria socialis]